VVISAKNAFCPAGLKLTCIHSPPNTLKVYQAPKPDRYSSMASVHPSGLLIPNLGLWKFMSRRKQKKILKRFITGKR
jgi:hypothetical protein